jgi:hypothetical protein
MLRLYLVLVCFLPTWKTVGQGGEVLRGAVEAEVQSGPTELEAVYRNRAFEPIWINELGKPGTSTETLNTIIDKGNETTINLPAPIPVYVMYWTAWADAEAAVHFRDDVYGHDLAMERAFERGK